MQYWPPSQHYRETHEYFQKRIKMSKNSGLDWNVRKISRHVEHALENTDIENRILIMEQLIAKYRQYVPPPTSSLKSKL